MSFIGWKQLFAVYFYMAVVVCLIAFVPDDGFSWRQKPIFIVLGVLSWTAIEYGLHRFIFHYHARSQFGRKLLYAAHISHHENPGATYRLFSSLFLSVPIATAYLLLARVVAGSWQAASYLFLGLTVGYFCYEWLHFQAHHRRPRLRLFRYLRRYHLRHHYQTPELRFGVTSPLFDIIFSTFHKKAKGTQNLFLIISSFCALLWLKTAI